MGAWPSRPVRVNVFEINNGQEFDENDPFTADTMNIIVKALNYLYSEGGINEQLES